MITSELEGYTDMLFFGKMVTVPEKQIEQIREESRRLEAMRMKCMRNDLELARAEERGEWSEIIDKFKQRIA